MGNVIKLPRKRVKEPPRGPRGGVLLRVGQTWVHNPSGEEVVVRKLGEKDKRGKQRVSFSRKRSRGYWRELAEMTFRSTHFEKSEWIKFNNELRQKLQNDLDEMGAHPFWYGFFDIKCTPPGERELEEVEPPPRKQPHPRRGELWKRNYVGRNGPLVCLVERVMRGDEWDSGYTIQFVMRGGWGVQPAQSFREEHIRIGWLGET